MKDLIKKEFELVLTNVNKLNEAVLKWKKAMDNIPFGELQDIQEDIELTTQYEEAAAALENINELFFSHTSSEE